jgi:hypothetical protein
MVARSWLAAFDWPEFWNPKVRAADCMNPQSARSMVPIVLLRSTMVMAGRSKTEMLSAIKAAFANGQVPTLESGAMDYMMSKTAYLTDQGDTHRATSDVLHCRYERRGLGLWRGGVAAHLGALLVLLGARTIANERAASDSCVPHRRAELV